MIDHAQAMGECQDSELKFEGEQITFTSSHADVTQLVDLAYLAEEVPKANGKGTTKVAVGAVRADPEYAGSEVLTLWRKATQSSFRRYSSGSWGKFAVEGDYPWRAKDKSFTAERCSYWYCEAISNDAFIPVNADMLPGYSLRTDAGDGLKIPATEHFLLNFSIYGCEFFSQPPLKAPGEKPSAADKWKVIAVFHHVRRWKPFLNAFKAHLRELANREAGEWKRYAYVGTGLEAALVAGAGVAEVISARTGDGSLSRVLNGSQYFTYVGAGHVNAVHEQGEVPAQLCEEYAAIVSQYQNSLFRLFRIQRLLKGGPAGAFNPTPTVLKKISS